MIGKHLSKEKLRSGFVFKVVDAIRDMPIPSLPKPRPIRWAPSPVSIGLSISIGIALLIGIIGYGTSSVKDVSSDIPILEPAEATFEVSLLADTNGQTVLEPVSDMEVLAMGSEDISPSDLASADAGTTTQTQPATGTESSGIVVRRLRGVRVAYGGGSVSPDGRYFSDLNWDNGNLTIHDSRTGERRDITDEGHWGKDEQFADYSIWSPDSKQIAYFWHEKPDLSLRIVDIDGSKPRVLYSSPAKSGALIPGAWSRDGKHILALHHNRKSKTRDIVLMSVADGSMRVLKSLKKFLGYRMSLSPDGRYVVYDYPQSGRLDIFLVATDGSQETTLVKHPAGDRVPLWAPDGDRIVFLSDRSGSTGIWVLEVIDGKPKGSPQLIKQFKNVKYIAPFGLTQNGSYYYGAGEPIAKDDIYFADLDPETGEVVTPPAKAAQSFEGFNRAPAFSPDGKYLAYVSKRPRGNVLVIRSVETGEERILSPEHINIGPPCWSPDGRSILNFANGLNVHQIDTETGKATPVVRKVAIKGAFPVWSPDRSKIFFIQGNFSHLRSYGTGIGIYDLETERKSKLDLKLACGEGYGIKLALSPDGQQLAFVVSCDNEWSLQIAPSSGGDTREVLRLSKEGAAGNQGQWWGNRGLTWTPDGRYLLFPGNPKDKATGLSELWRIPVEGGEPQNLGLTVSWYYHLSFHPDGRRIAFTGPGPEYGGDGRVWAIENFLPGLTAEK